MTPEQGDEFDRLWRAWHDAAGKCWRHGHDHSACIEREAHEAGEMAREKAWSALIAFIQRYRP